MENLLRLYCQSNFIKVKDICGESRANGLPVHRHIFSYCVKKSFPSIKLWQIGIIINKKEPSVLYGINNITNKLSPIKKEGKIVSSPPDIRLLSLHVATFLVVCKKYKRSDLTIPEKD